MRGQIIKSISGFFDIESNEIVYRVRGSGNLRNQNIIPIVGDYVDFEPEKFLTKIIERKNELVRPKVSNIDKVVLVFSIKEPEISSFLIDKYLAIIEYAKIEPIILLTKSDLGENNLYNSYKQQNYNAFLINNNNFIMDSKLKELLTNNLIVFMGQSGVGKSTTINNIAGTDLKTQQISKALGRGKHTTRVVEIIKWKMGRLIDTPGFSSFDLNLTRVQYSKSFLTFRNLSQECKFPKNCLHWKEKNCKIKDMIGTPLVPKERYENYVRMLEELEG